MTSMGDGKVDIGKPVRKHEVIPKVKEPVNPVPIKKPEPKKVPA